MHSLVQTILGMVVLIGSGSVFVATLPQSQSQLGTPSAEVIFESSAEIQPCNITDAGKDECIRHLFDTILPQLNVGIPELNMASIEPYLYKGGIFRYADRGMQGGVRIKNLKIYGISSLKILKISTNFTDSGLLTKISASIPRLQADGFFKADVKFGGLRLAPKGGVNLTIENIKANILTSGIIEPTENGTRLKLQRLNATVAIGSTKIDNTGIFSDKNLNARILKLVNENLPEITRVGIPATRNQWAPILVQHINNFFADVPLNKLILQ